jgi:hypothetical protein
MTSDQDRRFTTAASFGLTATRTILENQAVFLRFWADNIERFARIYEKETESVKSGLEQELRQQAAE